MKTHSTFRNGLMQGLLMGFALSLGLLTPAAAPAPVEHTGLAVGAKAPAFVLKAQDGKDYSLDALLRQGPVAVVFYRSADW